MLENNDRVMPSFLFPVANSGADRSSSNLSSRPGFDRSRIGGMIVERARSRGNLGVVVDRIRGGGNLPGEKICAYHSCWVLWFPPQGERDYDVFLRGI